MLDHELNGVHDFATVQLLTSTPAKDEWQCDLRDGRKGTLIVHKCDEGWDGYDWSGDDLDEDSMQEVLNIFDTAY